MSTLRILSSARAFVCRRQRLVRSRPATAPISVAGEPGDGIPSETQSERAFAASKCRKPLSAIPPNRVAMTKYAGAGGFMS